MLRVYLDTSVFSAYEDDRVPERQAETRVFFARRSEFEVSTSELARRELERTPDPSRRDALLRLLDGLALHTITDPMRRLADQYVALGIFSSFDINDALHVAAAVLTRQDVLLSWNFKHLVNRRRRAMVNQTSVALGLPILDIVAPPEL